MELRQCALRALCAAEPAEKVALARELHSRAATLPIAKEAPAATCTLPGRPDRPHLVHPAKVPRRSPATPQGLAALLHAIAHIEFNAINLALDAVWRYDGMPREYYLDWVGVAAQEAYHFTLLREQLVSLGVQYGNFEAHDNLWAMCERTRDDITARMALVPRTLEARGLDASPLIQDKLRQVGTPDALRAVDILEIILRDEVGHVAIGNRWYRWLCERQGLDPVSHYAVLADKYHAPKLHPPFNEAARMRAGFTQEEIILLTHPAPMPSQRKQTFPIVCVGGSAGGLDAYIRLLRNLPPDMGVAIVIVNHMRTVATQLHEILPGYTTMPVDLITDKLTIEPNHVFIIPENRDLHVANRQFRLKPISKPRGWPDVITVFLRSMTRCWGGKLVAVIVSGYDGDGAEALCDIQKAGGITIAQELSTARHADMPQSAIASGCIDFVLSPEDIAKELVRIASDEVSELPVHPAAGGPTPS